MSIKKAQRVTVIGSPLYHNQSSPDPRRECFLHSIPSRLCIYRRRRPPLLDSNARFHILANYRQTKSKQRFADASIGSCPSRRKSIRASCFPTPTFRHKNGYSTHTSSAFPNWFLPSPCRPRRCGRIYHAGQWSERQRWPLPNNGNYSHNRNRGNVDVGV